MIIVEEESNKEEVYPLHFQKANTRK